MRMSSLAIIEDLDVIKQIHFCLILVGVDVVRQTADPEMGDYEEPIFLQRLGNVPTAGN